MFELTKILLFKSFPHSYMEISRNINVLFASLPMHWCLNSTESCNRWQSLKRQSKNNPRF